jgi:hypothetical protein
MNKHTPGPWAIAPDPEHLTAAPLVISESRNIAKVLYYGGSEDNQVNANAYLIAAAPEMLEALENTFWLLDHRPDHEDIRRQQEYLKIVITKAKGE